MQITIDLTSAIIHGTAFLWMLLTLLMAAVMRNQANIYAGGEDAFVEQVSRLVRMSNIDRAIKLCNSLTEFSRLASALKVLLTHANKGHSGLERACRVALNELEADYIRFSAPRPLLLVQLMRMVSSASVLAAVLVTHPSGWLIAMFAVAILATIYTQVAQKRIWHALPRAKAHLEQIHLDLQARFVQSELDKIS